LRAVIFFAFFTPVIVVVFLRILSFIVELVQEDRHLFSYFVGNGLPAEIHLHSNQLFYHILH